MSFLKDTINLEIERTIIIISDSLKWYFVQIPLQRWAVTLTYLKDEI